MFSFSHWHLKGLSSKRIALKVDVTGPEHILFAGVSVPSFSPDMLHAAPVEGKLEREEKSETRITASSLRHIMFIVSHLVHVIRKKERKKSAIKKKRSSFLSHLIFHCL